MTPCDNCIENECEVNGYVCPLYKKYQESEETEKMNNKESLNEALDLAIKSLEDKEKMTNTEVVEQLKKLKSFHNGSYGEAINRAIKALDLLVRLEGFKYVTTDVMLREHELAQFDVYKTGWNDAIEAVKVASDRPLSEIINAIKETEAREGYDD